MSKLKLLKDKLDKVKEIWKTLFKVIAIYWSGQNSVLAQLYLKQKTGEF